MEAMGVLFCVFLPYIVRPSSRSTTSAADDFKLGVPAAAGSAWRRPLAAMCLRAGVRADEFAGYLTVTRDLPSAACSAGAGTTSNASTPSAHPAKRPTASFITIVLRVAIHTVRRNKARVDINII